MAALKPAPEVGEHPEQLFRFLLESVACGERCALVTIVGIVDTASRRLGSHMVVTEAGRFAGSVSSGCVDANVAQAALKALEEGQPARMQLGAGSGFVDIRLPCGGGLDLLVVPDADPKVISPLVEALRRRCPGALHITPDGLHSEEGVASGEAAWHGESFVVHYTPRLRLVLAGRGPELTHFAAIAAASGFDVMTFSPDPADVEICHRHGVDSTRLTAPQAVPKLDSDPWTAVVLLFHDHDWEAGLLETALAGGAFYIGALGSPRTQAARLEMLRGRGVSDDDLARIQGPIGLVPSMRNAPMLAISVLAEIVGRFNGTDSPGMGGGS